MTHIERSRLAEHSRESKNMNNHYVEMYCDKHNLKIKDSDRKFLGYGQDKMLLDDDKIVAVFSENKNYIDFIYTRSRYKKSNLLQLILNGVKAH